MPSGLRSDQSRPCTTLLIGLHPCAASLCSIPNRPCTTLLAGLHRRLQACPVLSRWKAQHPQHLMAARSVCACNRAQRSGSDHKQASRPQLRDLRRSVSPLSAQSRQLSKPVQALSSKERMGKPMSMDLLPSSFHPINEGEASMARDRWQGPPMQASA